MEAALKENINLRKVDKDHLSVAFDEAKKLDDVNLLLKIFGITKVIKQDVKVELDNLPKKSFKNFKILNSSSF